MLGWCGLGRGGELVVQEGGGKEIMAEGVGGAILKVSCLVVS